MTEPLIHPMTPAEITRIAALKTLSHIIDDENGITAVATDGTCYDCLLLDEEAGIDAAAARGVGATPILSLFCRGSVPDRAQAYWCCKEAYRLAPRVSVGDFLDIPAWKTYGTIVDMRQPTYGSDEAVEVLVYEESEAVHPVWYHLEPGEYTVDPCAETRG